MIFRREKSLRSSPVTEAVSSLAMRRTEAFHSFGPYLAIRVLTMKPHLYERFSCRRARRS